MENLVNNIGYVLKFDKKINVKVEFPLIGTPDGSFDYQIDCRLNLFEAFIPI